MTEHIQAFTSIISLLTLKHPNSKAELTTLRSAIIQWNNEHMRIVEEKNRAIMSAKSRGNQDMKHIMDELQQYLDSLGRHFCDPNLRVFEKKLGKIKDSFEFQDLKVDRFIRKTRTTEVQTDAKEEYLPGFDIIRLIKKLEEKEEENRQLSERVKELILQIDDLNQHIEELEDERARQENDYAGKLSKLRSLLETTKQKQSESASNNQHTYRSYPEFRRFGTEKRLTSFMEDALEEVENQMKSAQNGAREVQTVDQDCIRMLLSQAMTIEGIMQQIRVNV